MNYELFDISKSNENFFSKIGNEWAILSASKDGKCNGMTVSWGGVGVLWGKNVFFCFVRPQRFTKGFCDASDTITLSFFDDEKKDALKICGSKSGRDCDKFALAGLTPIIGEYGEVDFEESRMTLVGRKLFTQELSENSFIDKSIVDSCYPGKDYHTMYVCEILQARRK
ncbi:MAG: flavin reductase [Clostridia bacterium]|nr:flavin reductase [Clostridia bacterium]